MEIILACLLHIQQQDRVTALIDDLKTSIIIIKKREITLNTDSSICTVMFSMFDLTVSLLFLLKSYYCLISHRLQLFPSILNC